MIFTFWFENTILYPLYAKDHIINYAIQMQNIQQWTTKWSIIFTYKPPKNFQLINRNLNILTKWKAILFILKYKFSNYGIMNFIIIFYIFLFYFFCHQWHSLSHFLLQHSLSVWHLLPVGFICQHTFHRLDNRRYNTRCSTHYVYCILSNLVCIW